MDKHNRIEEEIGRMTISARVEIEPMTTPFHGECDKHYAIMIWFLCEYIDSCRSKYYKL